MGVVVQANKTHTQRLPADDKALFWIGGGLSKLAL
jgi:hypothetical protein